jgi:hypothetical protein
MMNLAETWRIRDKRTNPCDDVERYPKRKRERFLSPTELQRLGQALTTAEVSASKTAIGKRKRILRTFNIHGAELPRLPHRITCAFTISATFQRDHPNLAGARQISRQIIQPLQNESPGQKIKSTSRRFRRSMLMTQR